MISSKDILGQPEIIRHIKNAKKTGNFSNAYIIEGPAGSGKKLIAGYFAALLQCESDSDEPCGSCHMCVQSDSGNNPDIITITHEKPGVITTDEIRAQLVSDMEIKPYAAKYKIYIIPDADKMTPGAQNAMLKTIEEPPEYGLVLLLVETIEKMLPTILSRCVTLNIKPVDNELMIKNLSETCDILPDLSRSQVKFALGNIGRLKEIVTNDTFREMKDTAMGVMTTLDDKKLYDMENVKNTFKNYKDNINELLDMILIWYRDILVCKSCNFTDESFYTGFENIIEEKAKKYSYSKINNSIDAIEKTKIRLAGNVNFDLAIEVLFMELKKK